VASAPGTSGTKRARRVKALCSFCCKPDTEVGTLVAGPGVFICDECVALCADIVARKPAYVAQMESWDQSADLDNIMASLPRVAQAGAQVEDTLGKLARQAHGLGASWTAIGAALGVSRQWAWQRFAGDD
jgi:hypothetical protein